MLTLLSFIFAGTKFSNAPGYRNKKLAEIHQRTEDFYRSIGVDEQYINPKIIEQDKKDN